MSESRSIFKFLFKFQYKYCIIDTISSQPNAEKLSVVKQQHLPTVHKSLWQGRSTHLLWGHNTVPDHWDSGTDLLAPPLHPTWGHVGKLYWPSPNSFLASIQVLYNRCLFESTKKVILKYYLLFY